MHTVRIVITEPVTGEVIEVVIQRTTEPNVVPVSPDEDDGAAWGDIYVGMLGWLEDRPDLNFEEVPE